MGTVDHAAYDTAKGIVPPFYVSNGQKWADSLKRYEVRDCRLEAPVYEDGIILPLRRRKDVKVADAAYMGGACDADGTFAGGHARAMRDPNLSCLMSYAVHEESLAKSDESVIFCGIIYQHFGHQLVDTVSRLWYLLGRNLGGMKIAFVMQPGAETSDNPTRPAWKTMLRLLGVAEEDVLIVREPTRFKKVVVPEEALRIRMDANAACTDVFRAVRDAVKPGTARKVFLSRGKFKRHDCVNEDFLVRFYERRGFEVVYPETLSFEEQVSIMAGAHEIASTLGTMSHLATLFSPDDARLTYFTRTSDVIGAQLLLDRLFGKQFAYVDATRNLLPTNHTTFAYLFGPTRYFRAYLDDAGEPYDEAEMEAGEPSGEDVITYLRTYERTASEGTAGERRRNQMRSSDFDMADVFCSLHRGLYDEVVDRGCYADASLGLKLEEEEEKLEERLLEKERRLKMERLLKAGDFAATPQEAVQATRCIYGENGLVLRLAAAWFPGLAADEISLEVVKGPVEPWEFLEHDAAADAEHDVEEEPPRRAPLGNSAVLGMEDVAKPGKPAKLRLDVRLDVDAIFDAIREQDGACCGRWDVRLEARGASYPIGLNEGERPCISFLRFFLCRDGALFVPHLSREGGLCFWYVGERRNDFSEDFFSPRMNRPLVNDLLYRIIRAERYDVVPILYDEFTRGAIWCVPKEDETVRYKGSTYHVAAYAYQEARAAYDEQPALKRWAHENRTIQKAAYRLRKG